MARQHPAFLAHERGGAAVEFAILAPVYLLMLCGMLAYGLYFGAAHSLQQLAADAARISIGGLDSTERNRLVGTYLDRHASGYMLIARKDLSFTIGDDPLDPTQYRVVLRYDAADLPIWNLYPPLPMPSRYMVYGATIRQGGL
ncbi:TadE/TadG family type IV pilus assembly protein [Devosia sp.]|uniref:TadE/TadG family type IV pilus assembly protein n=1 Tax=Devosia sp. TaxID=1871048 RepID=UPI001AC34B13|nr:TadE/TadG family type IV pilus assembly protein [Devosia sp.]MBN9334873.1 pilus assembly protein [Devosia sp.]